MEWALSTGVRPQTNFTDTSDYIGSVKRSRDADVCFKVRFPEWAFTSIGLTTVPVQSNWALGVRLPISYTRIELASYHRVLDCPNAAGPSEPKRTKSSATGGQTGACYKCGQDGHWANGTLRHTTSCAIVTDQ
jgi:hypothetical protein